jgi:autophagy-related protein 13
VLTSKATACLLCIPQVPLTVYNAIGVMLKSVIIVSRSTPVYQLSRRQKNDNFDICYNVCFRDPSIFLLGDEYQRQLVGIVPSPLGAITSFLVYRTKLTTVPQHSIPDLTSTIKDDHFNKPFCRNKTARYQRGLDADMIFGTSPGQGSVPMEVPHREGNASCQKRAAFGSAGLESSKEGTDTDLDNDVPFSTLLQLANSPPAAPGEKMPRSCSSKSREAAESGKQVASADIRCTDSVTTTKDDFVLVELRAPFVGQEEDLGKFYRDCQMAPTLSMFEQTGSLQDMINSITDQLTQFEASANDFNEFVNSLQDIE